MDTLPRWLRELHPVHVAPMAGGPSTPALVAAAGHAGFFAQLAGGYRTAQDLAHQIATLRDLAPEISFGVNLFAPNPVPITDAAYDAYTSSLLPLATRLGVHELPTRREDDDAWHDKLALLLAQPVPLVSFTFGVPPRGVVTALRRRGTTTLQTVTNPGEATRAAAASVDGIIVQGAAAGGHSATLDPTAPLSDLDLPELVRPVRAATALPIIAAGGIGDSAAVRAVLKAGAEAAMVGTVVLRADEAGTSPTHRAALVDSRFTETQITTAFTGRPARGLRNDFMDAHPAAPLGYPALHHLTRQLRSAAAAAGDRESLHLWAGTAWRNATEGPVSRILTDLARES